MIPKSPSASSCSVAAPAAHGPISYHFPSFRIAVWELLHYFLPALNSAVAVALFYWSSFGEDGIGPSETFL